jgi:hypothetical protein
MNSSIRQLKGGTGSPEVHSDSQCDLLRNAQIVTSRPDEGFSLLPNAKIKIWGASRIFWFYMIVYLFYGGLVIWLLVAGALEKNGTAPFVTGIIGTAMMIPIYALLFGNFVRPLTIEGEILKIPTTFGHREVSLRTLSGVGLIYRLVPRTPGWMLSIWGDDGKSIQIRRFTVTNMRNPKLASGVKRRIGGVRDWTIPLPKENTKILGLTKSGRVATTLFESALAVQGTGGPLVQSAKQKAVVYDPNSLSKTLAWWSPDGYMGRARGLPGPNSAQLADPSQCDVAAIPSNAGMVDLSHAGFFPEFTNAATQSSLDEVPQASPEVRKARKRNLLMTFASVPFFIAIAIAFSLLLGHPGQLASGEVCAAVLGPAPVHASATCNAWRHHQLISFVWIGILLALGFIATFVFQIRATRNLVRASKAASASTGEGK